MNARASWDIWARIRRLPGRILCLLAHRRMWKPVRFLHVYQGRVWTMYRCRVCGREHVRPREGERP
jgi:hypothetical protein